MWHPNLISQQGRHLSVGLVPLPGTVGSQAAGVWCVVNL